MQNKTPEQKQYEISIVVTIKWHKTKVKNWPQESFLSYRSYYQFSNSQLNFPIGFWALIGLFFWINLSVLRKPIWKSSWEFESWY